MYFVHMHTLLGYVSGIVLKCSACNTELLSHCSNVFYIHFIFTTHLTSRSCTISALDITLLIATQLARQKTQMSELIQGKTNSIVKFSMYGLENFKSKKNSDRKFSRSNQKVSKNSIKNFSMVKFTVIDRE